MPRLLKRSLLFLLCVFRCAALTACRPTSDFVEFMRRDHLKSGFTPILSLTMMGLALAGCRQNPHQTDGVELGMSSKSPTSGMTFELRFDSAMVRGH